MDLTILFSPIDESVYANITSHASFYKSIRIFGDKMPAYKDAHIAIFGVKESRGSDNNSGASHGPDEIRKKLYQLKKGNGSYRIVDLGNLNPGHDLDETYVRVSEVCRILLENNVLPVIIGGTHDLDYGQYSGYETMSKLMKKGNAILEKENFENNNKSEDNWGTPPWLEVLGDNYSNKYLTLWVWNLNEHREKFKDYQSVDWYEEYP